MPSPSVFCVVSSLLACACATSASADFIVPTVASVGWERGVSPLSAYAEWDRFTSPSGPNLPDVGVFTGGSFASGAPSWNAFDREPNSFVTGGGNIYSFGSIIAPQVDVPGFGLGESFITTVLLQVRTQGTEIDPLSVLLGGSGPTQVVELARSPLGGFGGAIVDTLFRFDVTGNAAGYTLQFRSLSSSMSLDRIAVDTFAAVPSPGASALAAIAAGATLRRRRSPRGM